MKSGTFLKLLCGSTMAALAFVAPAHAAFTDVQTWSNIGNVEGWTGDNPTNPAGARLRLTNPAGPFTQVSARGLPSVYDGNWGTKFGTTGDIEWDELALGNNSTAPGIGNTIRMDLSNGVAVWRYTITGASPSETTPFSVIGHNANAGIIHRRLSFDATWSDAQANANGWVLQSPGASWAATVSNVLSASSFLYFAASSGGSGAFEVEIDNFRPGPTIIPEPSAAILLLSLGSGLLCGRSRRRS